MSMQEDFLERQTVFLGVGGDRAAQQRFGLLWRQVEFAALLGVPRSEFTDEHHAVAAIEEHLGRATGLASVLGDLVGEPDVTYALACPRRFPRLGAALVVERGAEVPQAVGERIGAFLAITHLRAHA